MTGTPSAADLTPAERRRRIAAILAAGVRHIIKAGTSSRDLSSRKVSDSASPGLEVPGAVSLTVPSGERTLRLFERPTA